MRREHSVRRPFADLDPTLRVFVATRRSDAPCERYVSVDGTIPGCVIAWDHHVSGEPTNLDALPASIDLAALAAAHCSGRIEGIGTTSPDADAVISAVVVLVGGLAALDEVTRDAFASAAHWCDHLQPHPSVGGSIDRRGMRLAEWIARELAADRSTGFERVVRLLETTVREGRDLPEADPDPAVDLSIARIAAEGRLRVRHGIAVVDVRDLPSLPPLRIHALHACPVTVTLRSHDRGGIFYVVGVNPTVPHPETLRPALMNVARAEFDAGPPCLRPEPEAGAENWGGRDAAFGSPWTYGSRLDPDTVARLVAEGLGLAP